MIMKAQSLVSVLLLALVLHVSWCREEEGYYTNRFAVQVNGGSEMASFVAKSHGMKNLGLVRISITVCRYAVHIYYVVESW